MSTSQAFFSYSRADSEFALKLSTDLRRAGANIWIDQLDISPGSNWDDEIENALNASQYMLIILSPKSITSTNVKNEYSYALDEGKRIIPIVISNCNIPLRLRRLQHIDFSSNYDIGLSRLLNALNVGKTKGDEEELLWQQTLNLNSINALQGFLKKYTNSKHRNEALTAIQNLKDISRQKQKPNTENILVEQHGDEGKLIDQQRTIKNEELKKEKQLQEPFRSGNEILKVDKFAATSMWLGLAAILPFFHSIPSAILAIVLANKAKKKGTTQLKKVKTGKITGIIVLIAWGIFLIIALVYHLSIGQYK